MIIETEGSQITGVRGDPDHPANFGKLCTKGQTLHLTASPAITQQTRLLQPLRRLERGGFAAPVSWDAALDLATDRFASVIEQHGPDAVGFYISGQLLTEDYYVFNKLVKGLIGTNNVDTNSRLCMSSAVAGYKLTLGADAPPACYDDVNHASCLFIVGSNAAFAHPVLFRRIEEAKKANPAMKVIVADPRRTDTAGFADLFLPLQPGSDVMLFHGLLHIMLWEGWLDAAYIADHTTGFDALKALVRECTPERVAQVCGLKKEDLYTAAQWFATSPATLSLYCQGLNQSSSGTAKNATLINLHLATGTIGRPGCGPFSLTGQPNAMGGRETGSLSNLLPGHRDAGNAEHRAEVAAYWGVEQLPCSTGLTAIELFEQVQAGKIKALWIACTNPAQSLPDQNNVRQALAACPFVVLQEAFRTTETAAFADLLLPAASWGEKEGTVTNSERRISHVRQAIAPPGEARPDWAITVDFAQRLERRLRPQKTGLFAFETPAQVFDEYKQLTRGQDLDLSGLSHALLDRIGPQQWPFPAKAQAGTPRLYTDGVFPTASGRAQFVADPYRAAKEQRDARFPLTLITGRLRDQWHGMSRTGTAAQLFGHVSEASLSLHPDELRRHRFKEGDLVNLKSRRGNVIVAVTSDDSVRPGQAFLPMHWGDRFLKGGVNALTQPAFDPLSKQPELKHSGVRLEAVQLPWHLFALIEGDVQQHFEALRPLCEQFAYVSLSLTGRERPALLVRAAHTEAPDLQLLNSIDRLLGLNDGPVMAYDDPRRSIGKRVRIEKGRITAIRLAGEPLARNWLQSLW
ncbi:molybdopterin oxidoreductase family protein, partial [Hydrogenophaga sp.]|uniref:molybdopterin oxidoreductase family protein n=1 Tax=Hydrogenophaga sp. TaxID=1904254 RepID=UPI0027302EF9